MTPRYYYRVKRWRNIFFRQHDPQQDPPQKTQHKTNALAGSVASAHAGRQILTRKLVPAKTNPTRKKSLCSACSQSQKVMKPNISSGRAPRHNHTMRRRGEGAFSAPQRACNGRQGKMRERHSNQNSVSFSKERAPFSQRVLNHRAPRKDKGA